MSRLYQSFKTSRVAQFFTVLALGGVVGTVGVMALTDADPPLSVDGRQIKQDILDRLSRAGAVLDRTDDCAAHYIAHQQSVRQAMREDFRQRASAEGVAAGEIDRVIGVDQAKDTPYALYVFMACRNGQKPDEFDPKMF